MSPPQNVSQMLVSVQLTLFLSEHHLPCLNTQSKMTDICDGTWVAGMGDEPTTVPLEPTFKFEQPFCHIPFTHPIPSIVQIF